MNKMLKVTEDAIKGIITTEMKNNPLITMAELAEKVGCTERSVYRYFKMFGFQKEVTKREPSPSRRKDQLLHSSNESAVDEKEMIHKLLSLGYTITKN